MRGEQGFVGGHIGSSLVERLARPGQGGVDAAGELYDDVGRQRVLGIPDEHVLRKVGPIAVAHRDRGEAQRQWPGPNQLAQRGPDGAPPDEPDAEPVSHPGESTGPARCKVQYGGRSWQRDVAPERSPTRS